MLAHPIKTIILTILSLILAVVLLPSKANAQACVGSAECCVYDCQNRCGGDPNGQVCSNPLDCSSLICQRPSPCPLDCHVWAPCPLNTSLGQVACESDRIDCMDSSGFTQSRSCTWISSSCPSGSIWCAACNACLPNTNTCNWYAANCCSPTGCSSGGGGGGGGGAGCGCCDASDWDAVGGCYERNGLPGLQCCCGNACQSQADGSCLSNPTECSSGGGGGASCDPAGSVGQCPQNGDLVNAGYHPYWEFGSWEEAYNLSTICGLVPSNCCPGLICYSRKVYDTPVCGGSGGFIGWADWCGPPTVVIYQFDATPPTGAAPFSPQFAIDISGTATGSIWYQIDCTSDGTYDFEYLNTTDPFTTPNICSYSGGTHTARLKVTRQGITATKTTTVTVNSAPSITINSTTITASPYGDGVTPTRGDDILVLATATDSDGTITRVDLFDDTGSGPTLLGPMTPTGAPNQYQFTLSSITAGNHDLTATATDDSGSSASDSTTLSVIQVYTVSQPATAPLVIQDEDGAAICTSNSNPTGEYARCHFPPPPPNLPQNPVDTGLPGTPSQIILTNQTTGQVYTRDIDPITGTITPFTVPAGVYEARLQIANSAVWFCGRPSSCTYFVRVGPDDQTLSYFVASTRDPWFQVTAGNLHAGDPNLLINQPAITSPVPFSCDFDPEGICQRYLILLEGADPATAGILTRASGTIDVADAIGNQTSPISQGGANYQAFAYTSPRENYAYFHRLFQLPPAPTDDNFLLDSGKPNPLANPPSNGTDAYFYQGDYTLNDANWTVPAGEALTVFVNGNLTLQQETHVAPGGFLAFIVSGDITIDPAVGNPAGPVGASNPTETDPNLEGVFIADGQINTGASANRLIAEGTFAAWGGFNFQRDYGDSRNNFKPAESFRYRPDFIFNAPSWFRIADYIWREVAP